KDELNPLTEADLTGHLLSEDEQTTRQEAKQEIPSSPLADEDYQLKEALNLLKGIDIVQKHD
ncbi:MAG: peptidase S41, partial [Pseudomonadota bacterium]|nr:peptidase S41 [Pseudomonadota bacterium]